MSRHKRVLLFCTILKYLLPLFLVVMSYPLTKSKSQIVYGFLDVAAIFLVSNIFLKKSGKFYVVNSIVLFLVNAEFLVRYFSGTYITFVMLQSLTSVEDLQGKAITYGIGVVAVIVFSFLPVRYIDFKKIKSAECLAMVLALELCLNVVAFENKSVLNGIYGIYSQYNNMKVLREGPQNAEDNKPTKDLFYRDKIGNYYVKQKDLPEKPNIVLIFVEGLSQSIIEDERNITPNIRSFQEQSLDFVNYYNHTFATYRALSGQLYSGYQLDDVDENALVSLQGIMRDEGYRTTFVNVEPQNEMFSEYLEGLGFDEVTEDMSRQSLKLAMSDKEAFDFLFEEMSRLSEEESTPFFLSTYTFNTHASLNSVEEKFGDGSDKVLNRFYNMDYQFQSFMDKFLESDMFDNTILVFTSDHAAYAEEDFINAFPNVERVCSDVDRMPFFIYHKGIIPAKIDAAGRNSLDMTPTVLDFLDIDVPNYFLGDSLFMEKNDLNPLQTTFFDPTYWKSTDNSVISDLSIEQQQRVIPKVQNYFSVKIGEN